MDELTDAAADAVQRWDEGVEAALSDWQRFHPDNARAARIEALQRIVDACGGNMSAAVRMIQRRFPATKQRKLRVTEGRVRQLLDS